MIFPALGNDQITKTEHEIMNKKLKKCYYSFSRDKKAF